MQITTYFKNMNRHNVKFKFPRKRTAVKKEPMLGIQEPKRVTAYDIICKNLKLAGRVTFLHRLIYTGHHNFSCTESYDDIITFFSSSINKANHQDGEFEILTGFLIIYPKYFVHLVEGDENTINLHLKFLTEQENFNQNFGDVKLITMVAHVNRRLINDWGYYYGIPQACSETSDSSETTISCILKIYELINQIVADYNGTSTMSSSRRDFVFPRQNDSKESSNNITSLSHGVCIGTGKLCKLNEDNTYVSCLPEYQELDNIIESSLAMNLSEYIEINKILPQRDLEKDNIWPIPSDFIPLDVFDKVYDRITELPKPSSSIEKIKDGIVEEDNIIRQIKNIEIN